MAKTRKRGSSKRRSSRRLKRNLEAELKQIRQGPPGGIISDSWVKKYCPCREGDDCIPCPYHLKKFKDRRKKSRKMFFGLF
jgi:hypothetical protein